MQNSKENDSTNPQFVKGPALIGLQQFILSNFHAQGFAEWLETLPDPIRDIYRSRIREDFWFPVQETLTFPTLKMCETFFEGDLSGAWQCGQFSAELASEIFMRVIIRSGSVRFILEKASSIMSQYHRPGRVSVVNNEATQAIIRLEGFGSMDVVVEFRMAGWMQRAVEISGQKNVNVEIIHSITRGDPFSDFKITWDE